MRSKEHIQDLPLCNKQRSNSNLVNAKTQENDDQNQIKGSLEDDNYLATETLHGVTK